MLGLPPTTEVKRLLPKAQLIKRFDWTASQRERFDADVSRLDFVNWISPRTLPAIPWRAIDDIVLPLLGLNLDAVWENSVSSIGQFSIDENNSLSAQIKIDEERTKHERRIATLERQMNFTKQPRRKRELFVELQKLKALI